MTYVLSQSAFLAKKDFQNEHSVGSSAALLGVMKTKFLQASTELLSVATSNSPQCQYYANLRTKFMSWFVALRGNFANVSVT